MNGNEWTRQAHRWLSIVFTLTVIANFVTMALATPPSWVVHSPLPPLFVQMFTGLYMLAQPHVTRWQSGKNAGPR